MKVKAIYRSKNPFLPNVKDLRYSKTVDVPDDTSMEVLEEFAKEDCRKNYELQSIEKL